MVFQLLVERPVRGGGEKQVAKGSSVFETFLGPHGEALVQAAEPPLLSPRGGSASSSAPRVDELAVSAVRLFRTGGTFLGGSDAAFERALPAQRTSALLLVAVPVELPLAGLRTFFGHALVEAVETLRVLRWEGCTGPAPEGEAQAVSVVSGDFYSVVLLCRTQEAADMLYQQHHGRILCEGRSSQAGGELMGAGVGAEDAIGGPCCYLLFLEGVAYRERAPDGAGAPLEVPNAAVELPMCPFCLERLDVSVTGMITHNAGWFSSVEWDEVPHSRCCAACTAIGRAARSLEGAQDVKPPTCQNCAKVDTLWVCLVCGHLGCGRYAQGHAKDHAHDAGHHFCLDLSSGRIWHYAGDVFVHRRLVQMAAASGRFEVALPEPADELGAGGAGGSAWGVGASGAARSSAEGGGKGPDALREGQLAMELDAVLASQLDYQRSLYEAKLRELGEQHQRASAATLARREAAEARRCALEAELAEAQQRRGRLEQRAARAQQAQAKAAEELEFAKEMNKSLLANRAEMRRGKAAVAGGAASGAPADAASAGDSAAAALGAAATGGADAREAAPAEEEDALVLRLRRKVEKLMVQVSGEC